MPISIDACVAQHQGDRREQQDRVAILPHPRGGGVALAVLADGMGGHTGGVIAAQQVIHTARNNLEGYSARTESARVLLESCINEAHMLIKASRFINEKDPHSTVVMLLLQPGRVSWAHCGDSRFYHFRGDALLFRSTDHSYVAQLVVQGRITPEQALVHPNRKHSADLAGWRRRSQDCLRRIRRPAGRGHLPALLRRSLGLFHRPGTGLGDQRLVFGAGSVRVADRARALDGPW
jgi:serine/threonine protein phosphatase PrpC